MAPLLVPIVSMLAEKGLGLLSSAIDGGAEKAKDFIEEKTGIPMDVDKGLSNEQIAELQKFEKTHALELSKFALEKLKEQNRHQEAMVTKQIEDTNSAREMFKHGSELQTKTANQVMIQTSVLIPVLIIILVILFLHAEQLGATNAASLSGVISAALMHLYNERKQLLGFLFGAMIAKVKKKEDA